MTEPSREAFEKWYAKYHDNACDNYCGIDCTNPKGIAEDAWQAAMAHKDAERQQANEVRRQAQTQLADMQEKRNRIGLDIYRALSGQVNEQSPIVERLRLIAANFPSGK